VLHSPTPFPGIRPDLLKTIEDNTYFRTAEKDAWFHFIELMQNETPGTIHAVPVEYAQLVDQPNVYRGKLVTVRGTARQITQEKPAANDLGITSYYRIVIQPADGANWPIIVYCLELPRGVAPGDDLSLDATVTGLFFKKLSYKWRDGLGIAPVIVAKNVTTISATARPVAKNQPLTDNVSTTDTRSPDEATDAVKAHPAAESIAGEAACSKRFSRSPVGTPFVSPSSTRVDRFPMHSASNRWSCCGGCDRSTQVSTIGGNACRSAMN
jgi:hypothetical protein